MKKLITLLLCAVMLLFIICGCSPAPNDALSEAAPEAAPEQESPLPPEETLPAQTPDEFTHLKVHMYGHYPYVSLDLLGNTAFADGVFDSLLYMDPDEPDNIKGCLAQSWTHSDDWLSWTFNIKEGITFSDGTACDAYAIAESFDILFGYCKNNSAKKLRNSINLINWEALGQYEFVLYLSSPCAWIETQLSIGEYPVINPTAFELYGENDIRAYVGTGPYVLEEYVEFDYDLEAAWVTLKANYNYHTPERAPIADKLTLCTTHIYKYSHEEMSQALMDGTLDAISLDNHGLAIGCEVLELDEVLALYTENENLVKSFSSDSSRTYWFDADNYEPFAHKNVREAICRLLDMQKVNEELCYGVGTVQNSIWAPGTWGCVPFDGYSHDAEKGLALLAEAGFSPQDIHFEAYIPGDRLYAQLSEQLEEYGIIMDNAWYEASSAMYKPSDYALTAQDVNNAYNLERWVISHGPQSPWQLMFFDGPYYEFTINSLDWMEKYETEVYEELTALHGKMVSTPHWDEMIECTTRMTELIQENYIAFPLVNGTYHFAVSPKAEETFDAFTQTNIFKWCY